MCVRACVYVCVRVCVCVTLRRVTSPLLPEPRFLQNQRALFANGKNPHRQSKMAITITVTGKLYLDWVRCLDAGLADVAG